MLDRVITFMKIIIDQVHRKNKNDFMRISTQKKHISFKRAFYTLWIIITTRYLQWRGYLCHLQNATHTINTCVREKKQRNCVDTNARVNWSVSQANLIVLFPKLQCTPGRSCWAKIFFFVCLFVRRPTAERLRGEKKNTHLDSFFERLFGQRERYKLRSRAALAHYLRPFCSAPCAEKAQNEKSNNGLTRNQ